MTDTGVRQRLAAILAADVAGYSRLMAADERATVAALDAARSVFKAQIESHQGRVIDMAGDSVLAVFETATGAVAAALAIQETLAATEGAVPKDRRMRFRIGLHLGDVIEKADGTVYGDGVNIAARLEGLAEPGGVTVSEGVQVALRNRVAANSGELPVAIEPRHALCGFDVEDVLVNLRAMRFHIAPGVGNVFGAQGGVITSRSSCVAPRRRACTGVHFRIDQC